MVIIIIIHIQLRLAAILDNKRLDTVIASFCVIKCQIGCPIFHCSSADSSVALAFDLHIPSSMDVIFLLLG